MCIKCNKGNFWDCWWGLTCRLGSQFPIGGEVEVCDSTIKGGSFTFICRCLCEVGEVGGSSNKFIPHGGRHFAISHHGLCLVKQGTVEVLSLPIVCRCVGCSK